MTNTTGTHTRRLSWIERRRNDRADRAHNRTRQENAANLLTAALEHHDAEQWNCRCENCPTPAACSCAGDC